MSRRIATLGPRGTDHERAARAYGRLRCLDAEIELCPSLDVTMDTMLGDPDALVIANAAHADVDLLTTRAWRHIGIVDFFGLATMPLALVRRRAPADSPGIAIMPATRGYLDLARFGRVDLVPAKPVALDRVLTGAVDHAVVSRHSYEAHPEELELLESIGPVECCWLVFGTRRAVPEMIWAATTPWNPSGVA
ncbi:hypothetical protein OG943_24800 [Amycolatopsis sp. NBC_00345]|uniref:hypothetical protein n=1 Tax=Amycolatopsis sp. NBC_00345 TaxID=2975955 RepID=UPI002E256050